MTMQQNPGDQIDYVTLLGGLSESDQEKRKQAEEVYESIPAKDRFSLLGAALCRREIPANVRVFAAILLRRLILSCWSDIQGSIPPQQLALSCNELLNILKACYNESVEIRDKLCQVIAILGKSFVDENTHINQWNDFIQFFFELLKSPVLELRETGFVILSADPEALGLANNQTAYIEQIHQCLMESFAIKGREQAFYVSLVSCTTSLIINNFHNKECIKTLSSLAMPLVEVFRDVGDEAVKEEMCQQLIEIAEQAPLSLRPAVNELMQLCIRYMNDTTGLETDLKFSALELVVSLIEGAPKMVKKRASSSIKPIILATLSFMSSIEDDPEWYTACTNDKDEDEPDAIGESALDRISMALGGKVLLPILMDELYGMLLRPEWQARHAALLAFSSAGEGCRDQLTRVLDRVVNGIITFFNDPHPRVRHAACNAIGQMSTDFSPEFENKYHALVIPSLCRLVVDTSHHRVQAHAACAMINFFEECPKEILSDYLDAINKHIEVALSGYMNDGIPKEEGKLFVIENVIVALSSVADSSAELFVNYYEKFTPALKFIIKNTVGIDDLRVLRGKAVECVSLIGMAVGKEKFCADASDIMQMLLATQTGEIKLADDDPQLSYMMAAWARICRILGPDFQPYLPYVMGPVLKAAAYVVQVTILDEADQAAIVNNSDWQSVAVKDQALGIRTAGLEDKATACSMLVCYARELKHGFVDYVEKTAEVMLPLLKFLFHDDVRSAAAEAMPYLLESAKPRGDQFVHSLWNVVFDKLVEALDFEAEADVVRQLFDSMADCIEVVGATSMTTERHELLTTKLNAKIKSHFDYLAEEMERRKDEDYESESECSNHSEQDCLAGIASVIHSLFAAYKSDYLPYFERLVEPIMRLSVSETSIPWSNRQTALCIWDDLIEYGGQQALHYQKFFLPVLSRAVMDKNKEIRQAALYGIGQLAQQNGPVLTDFFQTVIPGIVQLVGLPDARDEECIMSTENGISAVGRILRYCPNLPNHNDLLTCWIGWLPIWEDESEVPVVMDYLLQLIEQNNPTVMGPNSSNLPHLVAIVAETFARSAIDSKSEVGTKLVNFLKQVHANPALSSCLSSLSAIQQKAVQEVISQQ